MSQEDALALIENIITCVNVFASIPLEKRQNMEGRTSDIYIYAYKELTLYLKHLFVHYNEVVKRISKKIEIWEWFKFFKNVYDNNLFSEITVITYNYDIWLERILNAGKVPFRVGLMPSGENDSKITIYKPHGSISFSHKEINDQSAFEVKYDFELLDAEIQDFEVKYEKMSINYSINALIPPAGDPDRLKFRWADSIKNEVLMKTEELGKDDEVLICGISYWHVDRAELDKILTSCDPKTNVKMINPSPSRSLEAVLASIFDNFISYPNANVLKDMYHE